jgi:hypothetical protein
MGELGQDNRIVFSAGKWGTYDRRFFFVAQMCIGVWRHVRDDPDLTEAGGITDLSGLLRVTAAHPGGLQL